ncbi:hypothetical protein ACP87_10090 [Pseudomonas oleovorans]|nr:hypothetical protein [Pseudomonas oleovorans]MBN7132008.1 hypothetical protein [Pseudomonas oleovorans]MBN7141902.1 hypothetical protein [Pseudomonas oleovorans]
MVVTRGQQSANPLSELKSLWDGLNPHLIARLYEVDHRGVAMGGVTVLAALTEDTQLELSMNWQSPFENAGPESKAPALMAMIQSGAVQPILERTAEMVEKVPGVGSAGAEKLRSTQLTAEGLRGRTGMTKLNSTQVFSGMPPIKIQATLLLRAWRDPAAEVEQPLDQLMQWALPRQLAPEGTMLTAAMDYAMGKKDSLLDAAFPSLAPTLVGLKYKGRLYAPLVIETVSVPLGSPIDKLGRFVQLAVPVTFSTLTAWDGADWAASNRRYS